MSFLQECLLRNKLVFVLYFSILMFENSNILKCLFFSQKFYQKYLFKCFNYLKISLFFFLDKKIFEFFFLLKFGLIQKENFTRINENFYLGSSHSLRHVLQKITNKIFFFLKPFLLFDFFFFILHAILNLVQFYIKIVTNFLSGRSRHQILLIRTLSLFLMKYAFSLSIYLSIYLSAYKDVFKQKSFS